MAIPSGLRLIPIYDGMPQAQWSALDPATFGTFGADLSRVLRGGAITGVTAKASPPLLPLACTTDGSTVAVVLTGGTDGTTGRVEITVRFEDGQTDRWAILLPIVAQGILEVDTVVTAPVTTNGNQAAVLASIPIIGLGGSAADIEGKVLARNMATDEACSFSVAAVVTGIGTPQASVGTPSITAFAAPSSMAACAVTVSVSSNMITIWGIGLAGGQVSWTTDVEVVVA